MANDLQTSADLNSCRCCSSDLNLPGQSRNDGYSNYPIIESGVLRPNAENLIISDTRAARKFLSYLIAADLNFTNQQRIISLIYRLSLKINSKEDDWADLKYLFDFSINETLKQIENKTNIDLEDSLEFNENYFSEACNLVHAIEYGLGCARANALVHYLKAMIDKYQKFGSIVDLCADTYLIVNNKFTKKEAKEIAGEYGRCVHGRIEFLKDNSFMIKYHDFPSGVPSCASFQEKAYLATLDILEKNFLARPRVVMNYWD